MSHHKKLKLQKALCGTSPFPASEKETMSDHILHQISATEPEAETEVLLYIRQNKARKLMQIEL